MLYVMRVNGISSVKRSTRVKPIMMVRWLCEDQRRARMIWPQSISYSRTSSASSHFLSGRYAPKFILRKILQKK